MADLRTCYFCGTGPGGSLDSYGVVPSTLDPSPDEQRSVVLCPDCRNKLTALLKPVAEAADSTPASGAESGGLAPADDDVTGLADSTGGATESPGQSTAEPSGSPAREAGGAPGSASSEAGGAPESPSPDAGNAAGEPADAGGSVSEQPEVDPSPSDPAGSEPASTSDPATMADQSVTFDEEGASPESDSGLADSAGESDDAPSKPEDPSAEAMMGDDSEAYRKVIRLLQNRDFPVQRAEIEELATSAYEIQPGECSGAIDTIIQKGLLVEEEGTLRRTGD